MLNRDEYQTLILDSLPHWAMLIDGDTRTILAANKKAKELGSKLFGQCWDDFGHRQSLSAENLKLIETCPNRKKDNTIKCTFCEADEAIQDRRTHHAEVTIDSIVWHTHWVPIEKNIYLHYAIDITDMKEVERLKLDSERLETTIQTIGAVTHEMSQPLMVIIGHLAILSSDIEGFRERENTIKINTALDKLQGILHKLHNITQVKTKTYLKGKILDIEESSKALQE